MYKFLGMALIIFLFTACTSVNENHLENADLVYYLDGQEVEQESFRLDDESMYILVSSKLGTNGENNKIIFNGLTTKEKYIQFGKKNNLKLEELLGFEEHMHKYAESSGAIDEWEKTDRIPNWYSDYEAQIYYEYFGTSNQAKSILTILHKNYFGGPDRAIVFTAPGLCCGWNNTVSAFTPIGIYGFTILYDRSFYRRRMITIWSWGMSRVRLYWGYLYNVNNRTSSVISH